MSPVLALSGGLVPVVARFDPDDWGLIAFFVIAAIIRLVEMIRTKAKRAPAPPEEEEDDVEVEVPQRRPRPTPTSTAPDPWRRAPAPPPIERAPARPAPRPVVHDQEGPDHTLVDLGPWKPHEFESERKAKDKAAGKSKPKAKAPPPAPRDARPAGRALLLGSFTAPRDRMRAAIAWKEVLDRPRGLRMRRPPSPP